MDSRWVDTIRRAQHREREAFELLVEQHVAAMFRLAAAIVGPADAADVTQNTFIAAWQQLPRLRDPGAFPAWLRRICVNRARNWLRDSKRRAQVAPFDFDQSRPPLAADFGEAVEARAILDSAFERLSPDQRAVLALHYSLGYSIGETAAALGVPPGTAKSRLNAGLRVLRRAAGGLSEIPETTP